MDPNGWLSVTEVLRIAGVIDDRYFNDAAAERGTAVHQACAAVDRGEEPFLQTPEVKAWKKWREAFPGYKPIYIEHQFRDDKLKVFGTPDVVFEGPPPDHVRRFLIERKTGTQQPWHRLQAAGYSRLVANLGGKDPLTVYEIVYLLPNGDFRMADKFSRYQADVDFISCLRVARMKLENLNRVARDEYDFLIEQKEGEIPE